MKIKDVSRGRIMGIIPAVLRHLLDAEEDD